MIKPRPVTYYLLFLFAKKKVTRIRALKKIVRWVLGILIGGYTCLVLLLNIPYVQQRFAALVANELSEMMGTKLTIANINMGLLNRIIIDDLLLDDQTGNELLKVSRLSAKFEILPLFNGKISISSVQLFGFNANLSKSSPETTSNFQFVLDAFASKDTVRKESTIDLRINSALIRRGKVSYDVLSEQETPGQFNTNHLKLQNIAANLSLKALQADSINASIKRFSVEEQSGIHLKKLQMKLVANNQGMRIDNFETELPGTLLRMDTIRLSFDSLGAFNRFADEVEFSFRTLPSHITLKDISPFVPALAHFHEKLFLNLEMNGTLNQLQCPALEIHADNKFRLQGYGSLQDLSNPQSAFVFGKLSYMYASSEGIAFLVRNLTGDTTTPPLLSRLGDVSFNGEVSGYFNDLVTYGMVRTSIGYVKTDLKLSSNKEKQLFSYSGQVETSNLQLGKLLDDDKFGLISLNLDVQGNHSAAPYPTIILKGLVPAFEYSNYTYSNITLDGEYIRGGFNGKVNLDDENGSIKLNGILNLADKTPTFDFLADIRHFRPHMLNLTDKYTDDTELSLKLNANFTGASVDKIIGEINIDSLTFNNPEKQYFLNNLKISAHQQNEEKEIRLRSGFMTADIMGKFRYETLPASIHNILSTYIPSLVQPSKKPLVTDNNFTFDVHVYNTDILPTLFDIPLHVYTHSTLKGSINDPVNRVRIEGYFPRLKYNNTFIESGNISCDNFTDKLQAKIRFTNLKKEGSVNIALEAQAQNDQISATVNWGNSSAITYSGQLAAVANFFRTEGDKSLLKTTVDIQPTNVILNDTLWKIHPSQVVVDSGRIHINDFNFNHNERHVRINGCLSDRLTDTVKVDLQEINLAYVFETADITDDVFFMGEATGTAYACNVFKDPIMDANLSIRNFCINEAPLGDAQVRGTWDKEEKGVYLDALIQNKEKQVSHVNGHIFPGPKNALDLHIDAEGLNVHFLQFYLDGIANNIQGKATGNVHFYGPFKALNLDGKAMTDASFHFDFLNTSFAIKDTIRLSPNGLTFDRARIGDLEGHTGNVSGYVRFKHFKDITYRLDINANNLLVMNTRESVDSPFFGTVYGTGNAVLTGNADGLDISGALTPNRNTIITYSIASVASATNNQFIRFVDKTPRPAKRDSILTFSHYERMLKAEEEKKAETEMNIRMNLLLDVTPDATVRIIMDPLSGDNISCKGIGSIRADFYNKGAFSLFGNYNIQQGVYKFSIQEVIRKDFTIREGSNLTFAGDPYQANVDIKAAYTVMSASLNDLSPTASTIVEQPNVRVNCMMNLTGVLLHPTIKMGLEFPNEREEVATFVRNYLNTDEQMNTQILYLLGIGKFYTQDNTANAQNSDVMSSVLSSTISGQLNNVLSQIINNNNWNLGTNLSTGEKGWSEMEFEGVLSGQLLNNRLIINGNFGYRENPMANTNFVGDFDAEWLLTRSGDIRLKAYNKTNDRYYTKTNLTTQGVGLIYKKDFEKWRDIFFWNKWKANNLKKQLKNEPTANDSINSQAKSKRERE